MLQQSAALERFKALTWDDLEAWAGKTTVSRGRSYQRSRQVQGLAQTPSGGALAWVQGTSRYATRVECAADALTSRCTCPVGYTCKHAVAVVLDYLEHLEHQRPVPRVSEQDRRLVLLEDVAPWAADDDEDTDDTDEMPQRSQQAATGALHTFLAQYTREQLLVLLEELAARYPAVREALLDRRELATGAVPELVQAVRREIAEISAQPAWHNDWDDTDAIPDYSRVRERLEALLAQGHAEEVLMLGEELLEAGTQQVEMSQDEGETAEEIAACLAVACRALAQSSRPPAEQLRWLVARIKQDEFDLCTQGLDSFWQHPRPVADWQRLAAALTSALKQDKVPINRDLWTDWVITALEHAGRHDEIIPLCEREASESGNYLRLISHLQAAERWDEAEHWVRQGLQALRNRAPHEVSYLRTVLRDLRERANDWPGVAAFRAEEFFHHPTLETYQELHKAAEQAGAWPAVRTAALHYLETGKRPQVTARKVPARGLSPWPLPALDVPEAPEGWHMPPPMIPLLVAIAIAEKRPDDALRWYEQRQSTTVGWGWGSVDDDHVAQAVVETHPERAIAIWQALAEAEIARTNTSAYETAAGYLRKARDVLHQLGRQAEWQRYFTTLRQANVRKRRFVEILDNLGERRIIKST
jgi:uncharacterized Zn finger protein